MKMSRASAGHAGVLTSEANKQALTGATAPDTQGEAALTLCKNDGTQYTEPEEILRDPGWTVDGQVRAKVCVHCHDWHVRPDAFFKAKVTLWLRRKLVARVTWHTAVLYLHLYVIPRGKMIIYT